jgi:hypothetical protein
MQGCGFVGHLALSDPSNHRAGQMVEETPGPSCRARRRIRTPLRRRGSRLLFKGKKKAMFCVVVRDIVGPSGQV